jgi:hypothetical protein
MLVEILDAAIMRADAYCVDCEAFLRTSENMSHRHDHAGVISYANGSRILECTVCNSSASGAQVMAPAAATVPHRVELQEGQDAPRRAATVVWRRTGVLGVRFDEYFLRR